MKYRVSDRRVRFLWGRIVWVGLLLLGGLGCKPRDLARETPYMQSDPETWIRVRLLHKVTSCTIESEQALRITSRDGRVLKKLSPQETAQVGLSGNSLTLNHQSLGTSEVEVLAESPHLLTVAGQTYRGQVRLFVDSGQEGMDVINCLPMEPYLAGVIGAEMPTYWEPEALKAQTIVARTYCLYIKRRFGTDRAWDLSRTQAHQVYRGVAGESTAVWDAVRQTTGQVLEMKNRAGQSQLFPTYYSAVCGGHTEAAQNVFGEETSPLVGVACPYCEHVARMNQYLWPLARYSKVEVNRRLQARYSSLRALGTIVAIEPMEQSDYEGYSRITRVRLVGDNGKQDNLRAEDLRLVIDPSGRKIKSTICRIEDWQDQWAFVAGRGWGHGVGMCQCGAQGMAREGKRAEAILHHYFPHSIIKTIEP